MANIENDKNIEQNRYNNLSFQKLKSKKNLIDFLGSKAYPHCLQPPYLKYEFLINEMTKLNKNLFHLDLCCGDGIHSFTSANRGANVIALDYAENSITIAKKRAIELGINVDFKVCDVESLPFNDECFDLVTCIGSLSYLNLEIFLSEVKRVLKPGGVFIVIDSLNHNIFYKFNRFIRFLKKERSYSTLKRMPTIETLNTIKSNFSNIDCYYYGIFVFLEPILKIFLTEIKVEKIISKLDHMFPILNRYAFKIVFKTIK
jgi:ubiquinone/menaquinone biosynthesis C-methylase UbiE